MPGCPASREVRAKKVSGQVRNFYVNRRPPPGGTWPKRPIDGKVCPRNGCLNLVYFGDLEAVSENFIPPRRDRA